MIGLVPERTGIGWKSGQAAGRIHDFFTHLLLLALLTVQLPTWAAPGDLDATFGVSGRARISMPTNSSIQAALIQSDGKVVAVGSGNVLSRLPRRSIFSRSR